MVDKYTKNSLLGQLKKNGFELKGSTNGEYLPFGILTGNIENSPFAENQKQEDPIKKEQKIVKKRLNDFDFNIFQESNFLDIDDIELSKEEKISKIKKLIKKIDEKIFMLEDFEDRLLIEKLENEKQALLSTLSLLDENYVDENALSKNVQIKEIAQKIHIKDKIEKIEKIIFKICPALRKSFLVKKALNKLVMLNEVAKNLSSKQIPYGESEGRYNDFIAYLSCANVIHAKLTKKM